MLFLRSTEEDYRSFNTTHLAIGLVCTWLVGMGRHWDNPRIEMPMSLGVGSLAYVFVLALLLLIVGWPFRSELWTYRRILTMVVLSAPPAAIYAIPVERWLDFETARSVNVWFLAIVALWRMCIWGRFAAYTSATDHWLTIMSIILMPVSVILAVLVVLNLEQAAADFMSGLQPPPEGTTADAAYVWLWLLTFFTIYLILPIVAIIYVVSWIKHAREKRAAAPNN